MESKIIAKMKKNRIIPKILLMVCSILFTLAMFEISLRTFESFDVFFNCEHSFLALHEKSDDAKLIYDLKPNTNSHYECKTNIINSQGIRTEDITAVYNYTTSKFRIITIGDSITYGYKAEFNETYSQQLEKLFQSKGYNVEVINMGVNGYNTEQEAEKILKVALKFNPDLIIVGYVHNDHTIIDEQFNNIFNPDAKCDFNLMNHFVNISFKCSIVENLARIRTLSFFNAKIKNIISNFKNVDYIKTPYKNYLIDETRPDYPRYLAAFKTLGQINKKTPVLITVFPILVDFAHYPLINEDLKIKKIATSNGLPIIFLYDFMKNESVENLAVGSLKNGAILHENSYGYNLTAHALYKTVLENKDKFKLRK